MQEEADARQAESKPKPDEGRLMAVWAIKNGAGEIVATFPYARKEAALVEAARLQESEGRDFIVAPHKERV